MQHVARLTDVTATAPPGPVVLLVDDSRAQRQLLSVYLRRWGYDVLQSASAEEALALCAQRPVDLVISDWMMPGMNGVEFCAAFRQMPRDSYGYFILLTSKSAKAEIARGLEVGADDFVTKPVSADELHARLRAGMRILSMQAALRQNAQDLAVALADQQRLYDTLDRDLIEARKLQQTLMPDRRRDFGPARVTMLIRASGHVGGDLVGCFTLGAGRVAAYSVDVSGHGVASAMMTARLAGYLSGEQNLAFRHLPDGGRDSRSPAALLGAFNRLMIEELQVEQYFTMAYAELDLASGAVRLAQGGHPYPLVIRADGRLEWVGQGGLPIGLIAGAEYEDDCLYLAPGDRLLLMSDGITECPDPMGTELGAEGTERLVAGLRHLPSDALLDGLVDGLAAYAGDARFPDDVSGLIIDWKGG